MDLYTIGCKIEPPIVWYIQKCMLIWKFFSYFSFVHAIYSSKKKTRHVMRDRFTGLGPGQHQASTTIGQTQSTVTVENRLSETYKI